MSDVYIIIMLSSNFTALNSDFSVTKITIFASSSSFFKTFLSEAGEGRLFGNPGEK